MASGTVLASVVGLASGTVLASVVGLASGAVLALSVLGVWFGSRLTAGMGAVSQVLST